MPREISEKLKIHLAEPILKVAHCIKITFKNGEVLALTSHSQNIFFENVEFKTNSVFRPSAIIYKDGLAVDNLEVSSLLDLLNFSAESIEAGILDSARVEIFVINYENIKYGKMILFNGYIGQTSYDNNKFIAQVRGLTQKFSISVGSVYSPSCRASFCDMKCKLKIIDYSFKASVKKVLDDRSFCTSIIFNVGYFNNGQVEFLTGKNKGKKFIIRNYFEGVVELLIKPPYPLSRGDKVILIAGCDKSIESCSKKFHNAVNFRGEPHLPKLTN